ncbi:hypothetical protein ACJX0J_031351, partial [Zea mays]
ELVHSCRRRRFLILQQQRQAWWRAMSRVILSLADRVFNRGKICATVPTSEFGQLDVVRMMVESTRPDILEGFMTEVENSWGTLPSFISLTRRIIHDNFMMNIVEVGLLGPLLRRGGASGATLVKVVLTIRRGFLWKGRTDIRGGHFVIGSDGMLHPN